ncbi:MAG: hypothetical protein ACRD38_07830, partial [Nitrososphaerales archaeon]
EYAMLLGAKDTIISEKIKFMLLEVHTYEILNVITQLLSPLYDINIIKRTQDDRYYVTARLRSGEPNFGVRRTIIEDWCKENELAFAVKTPSTSL